MKIGIAGPGESGKDTAAEFLAFITHTKYTAGTSRWARHLVYERMTEAGHVYADADACWNDRRNHRSLWAAIIGEYNHHDPVSLYRDCLAEQNYLTGIRFLHEFRAIQRAGLCDLWIYVDRQGCNDSTCEIRPEHCDFTIHNYGTMEEFHGKLRRLAACLRIEAKEKPQTELNPLRFHKDEFGMYCWHAGNVDLMSGSPPASTP